MKIRSAVISDCGSLAKLNKEVQNPHARAIPRLFKLDPDLGVVADFFQKMFDDPDNHIFIVEDNGIDLGYLYCQILRRDGNVFMFPFNVVYIHHIAVRKDQQGSGCGRRLMEAAFRLAREENIRQVALDVWSFNENAQAFFKHLGFQTFNLRMNVWLPYDDEASKNNSFPQESTS